MSNHSRSMGFACLYLVDCSLLEWARHESLGSHSMKSRRYCALTLVPTMAARLGASPHGFVQRSRPTTGLPVSFEILTTRSLVPGGRPRALPRLGCLQHESKSAGVDAPRALTLLSLGHMPSPCLHVSGAAGTETLRTKSKENTLKRTGKYLQSRVPILQDRLPKRSRCLRILCRVITGPANAEEASSDSLELNELKDPTERWVNFHLISRAAEHQALRISWRALLCAIPSYHTITKQSSVAPHAFANRQAHL